jgi:hypothetical protein
MPGTGRVFERILDSLGVKVFIIHPLIPSICLTQVQRHVATFSSTGPSSIFSLSTRKSLSIPSYAPILAYTTTVLRPMCESRDAAWGTSARFSRNATQKYCWKPWTRLQLGSQRIVNRGNAQTNLQVSRHANRSTEDGPGKRSL